MKVLTQFSGLQQFGINPLTGEACAYGLRILCDLTEKGADLVRSFLGAPELDCFPQNWNSVTAGEGERCVCSVLLPRSAMRDLMIFALFAEDECSEVLVSVEGIYGLQPHDEYRERYLELAAERPTQYTVYTRPQRATAGRNVHLFTGRTV